MSELITIDTDRELRTALSRRIVNSRNPLDLLHSRFAACYGNLKGSFTEAVVSALLGKVTLVAYRDPNTPLFMVEVCMTPDAPPSVHPMYVWEENLVEEAAERTEFEPRVLTEHEGLTLLTDLVLPYEG